MAIMFKHVALSLTVCLLLGSGQVNAQNDLLARFFPAPAQAKKYSGAPLIIPAAVRNAEPDVDQFNAGVDLNNQGLEAMRLQDFAMASRLFAQACEKAPGEKGFWNNLLIATRKVKGNEIEAVKVAHQIVALDPGDAQAPYIAGLVYLNDLKRPAEAIPYLDYSLRVNPGDAGVALALANALEQAGYSDDAFEVLEKYARKTSADPYPLYLLGLQYLERKDYNAAIATLATARKLDNKGYSHDAYIRARYFAGQLDGLEQECRDVLRRFPEVLNRQSLERILLSLQAGDFRLVETISVKLSAASSIEKLDFQWRMPR